MKHPQYYSFLLLFLLSFSLWTCNVPKSPQENQPELSTLNQGCARIHIDKSDLKLYVLCKDSLVCTYPIVLGTNPTDDKRMEGDRCTPEGIFHLRDLYPHNKWSKFMWIDYPTAESQRKFEAAKAAGEIPQDATIGGEVGIHGVPEGRDDLIENGVHWTWGCISLTNEAINEIYPYCFVGMEVEITR